MKVIGLTGSIAMGKSEVAGVFRSEGFPVFDADAEVHKLYDSPEGAALIRQLAPDAIQDGRVDRARLSAIALQDKARLMQLEPVIHAEIRKRQEQFIEQARQQGARLAVVDVPLLFETGGDRQLDLTIVVSAPEQVQRRRALARPGMTPARLQTILARQTPDADKRKRATHIIENNASLEALQLKTRALIAQLLRGMEA